MKSLMITAALLVSNLAWAQAEQIPIPGQVSYVTARAAVRKCLITKNGEGGTYSVASRMHGTLLNKGARDFKISNEVLERADIGGYAGSDLEHITLSVVQNSPLNERTNSSYPSLGSKVTFIFFTDGRTYNARQVPVGYTSLAITNLPYLDYSDVVDNSSVNGLGEVVRAESLLVNLRLVVPQGARQRLDFFNNLSHRPAMGPQMDANEYIGCLISELR